MNITVWDLLHYIYKWKWLILIVTLGFFMFAVRYTDSHQTYNSQTIIKYNDSCISEGKTPDNKDFDPYEIVSPDIITAAIKDLSLNYSVDYIRSKVKITGIVPENETAMKEAKTKEGKEYTYYPNTFTVTYSGSIGESETQARDILDSIIQNYLEAYRSKYITQMTINDVTFDDNIGNYDYIEAVEIMDTRIDKTISLLNNYYVKDTTFRSPKTGLTFSDIQKEYEHLQEHTVAKIFSNIYTGQITKDKTTLFEKYRQRRDDYILTYQNFSDKADTAKEKMVAFVKANVNVPNSYNQSGQTQDGNNVDVLKDVYDDWRHDSDSEERRDVVTTFDTLIQGYVDASIGANNAKLNAEFCENVISKFTGERDSSLDIDAITGEIENDISYTKEQMNKLYKTLSITINDYNDTNESKHISQLTGVQYFNTKSLSIYAMIFSVFGLMISVLFAVSYEIIKLNSKMTAKKADDGKEEQEKEEQEAVGLTE